MSRHATLHLDNLHQVLTASPDGLAKGTMQFETPAYIAKLLAVPLPHQRPIVTDLQCGHGALLKGAANETTKEKLGVDIDPTAPAPGRRVATADIVEFFPLLKEIGAMFPLLTLNPPYGLRWPTTHIAIPKRPKEFGSLGKRQLAGDALLDSTYATWLMANELLPRYGEAYLIANAETAERLIATCPFSERIWLWLTMPNFFPDAPALSRVAVIYFCPDHYGGMQRKELKSVSSLELEGVVREAQGRRRSWLRAQTMDSFGSFSSKTDEIDDQIQRFKGAKQGWDRREAVTRGEHKDFNIQMRSGRISAYLTPFQTLSGTVPKTLAEALFKLHGRAPMEMMVMRDSRVALEEAINSGIWRVHPDVMVAIQAARLQYEDVRTPFNRPALAQRIGWLDEQDSIQCLTSWKGFEKGKNYPIQTCTFTGLKREMRQRPLRPGLEEVLVSGQELAIKIGDGRKWHAFTHHAIATDENNETVLPEEMEQVEEFHGLRDLLDHFEIPEVLDLPTRQPVRYAELLAKIQQIESQ